MLFPLPVFNHSLSFSIPKRIAERFTDHFLRPFNVDLLSRRTPANRQQTGASLIGLVCFDSFFSVVCFSAFGTDYRKKKSRKSSHWSCWWMLSLSIYITSEYFIVASADIFCNLFAFAFSPHRSRQHTQHIDLEINLKIQLYAVLDRDGSEQLWRSLSHFTLTFVEF